MRSPGRRRVVLGCVSVAVLLCFYTVASNAGRLVDPELLPEPFARVLRPDLLPPTQAIFKALVSLVTGKLPPMEGHHAHPSGHVSQLVEQHVTLQGALFVSVLRVLFGRERPLASPHPAKQYRVAGDRTYAQR